MSRYLMRFIGGKYEGGTVQLPDRGEVGIGRAQELDICLVEDMVSRHHAKLEIHADKVILTDLGSTNGTFVNGERVSICELEHEDRVLFGTSILRLEDTQNFANHEPAKGIGEHTGYTAVAPKETMSGTLADVSFSDLLQLLSGNGRSGTLSLTLGDLQAEVVLQGGDVLQVVCSQYGNMTPSKMVCRLLQWGDGSFTFKDDVLTGHPSSAASLGRAGDLMMDAARQNDEAERLWPKVGGHKATVKLKKPMGGDLSQLDARALEVLQLIWDGSGSVSQMADAYPREDAILLQTVQSLLNQQFVEPV